MGWLDDLLGNTSAAASNAAAADTFRKQQAASTGLKQFGDTFADRFSGEARAYDPYVTAGGGALEQLMAGLGLSGGPQGQAAFTEAFRNLPGYRAGLDAGGEAVAANANAGNMLQSGRTLKALNQHGIDYSDRFANNYLDRLTGLTGQGLAATGARASMVGQGLQGQLGARQSAFGGDMTAAGTIGQGQVAGAQAKQQGLQGLMQSAAYLGGMALGGGMGGGLGGLGSRAALPLTQQFPSTWIPAPRG